MLLICTQALCGPSHRCIVGAYQHKSPGKDMHMDKITLHANMPQLPLDTYWFQSVHHRGMAFKLGRLLDFIQNPVLTYYPSNFLLVEECERAISNRKRPKRRILLASKNL